MLGRRNALYEHATKLLHGDLFAVPDLERHTILNACGALLDEAITNTQAILAVLSNADTAAREKQFLTFIEMLRDLVESAARLTTFGDALEKDSRAATKFLGGSFNRSLNKNRSSLSACELHIVSAAQSLANDATPAIRRYWDYSSASFNKHNAERYHKAFEHTSNVLSGGSLEKPIPPDGW